jgi:hypothetical protein
MRRSLACTALIVGLVLTGCSSGGGATTAGSAPTKAGNTTAAKPASGDLDCSGLTKEDRADFIVSTQLLAQVRDQSTLDAIRNKTVGNYTPDSFAAVLAKMQFLAGHGVPGLGDPADSLAFYAKANDSVRALLAISGDVPKADFDAYQAQVGGASSVVMKQLPINAAISEYCPKGS